MGIRIHERAGEEENDGKRRGIPILPENGRLLVEVTDYQWVTDVFGLRDSRHFRFFLSSEA